MQFNLTVQLDSDDFNPDTNAGDVLSLVLEDVAATVSIYEDLAELIGKPGEVFDNTGNVVGQWAVTE